MKPHLFYALILAVTYKEKPVEALTDTYDFSKRKLQRADLIGEFIAISRAAVKSIQMLLRQDLESLLMRLPEQLMMGRVVRPCSNGFVKL